MNRGFTLRTTLTIVAFFALGGLTLLTALPGIMLFDAPGSGRVPLVVAAGTASMLAPVAFFAGALVLLPAGYFRWRVVVALATAVPLLVFATIVVSLGLLFTWCDGHTVGGASSRIGCRPL